MHLAYGGWPGADEDFLKEGALKLRTDRTSTLVGTGDAEGDVPPQKQRKIVLFKVNLHNLVRTSCLRRPHKVRRLISAKKLRGRRGVHRLHPPSKSAPGGNPELVKNIAHFINFLITTVLYLYGI